MESDPPAQVIVGVETGMNRTTSAASVAVAAADNVNAFVPTALTVVPVGMADGLDVSVTWSPTTIPPSPEQVSRFELATVEQVSVKGTEVNENATVPVAVVPNPDGTTDDVKWTAVFRSGGMGEPAR